MEGKKVMKKNKIIGIAVASAGILLSIGGAAALYTRAASPTGFGIGAGTYSGSNGAVTYKVNGNTSGPVAPEYWNDDGSDKLGHGLGGEYNQIVYEMALSAEYAAVGTHAQSITAGNLAVSLTNIPEAYRGHLALWVDIDGYTANTVGAKNYEKSFMDKKNGSTNEYEDFAISADEGHTTFERNRDIAVKSNGAQKLRIFMKFDETITAGSGLYGKNEASLGYKLAVTWGALSQSFESAHVVGNGNLWTEDDEFAMVPNIDAADWEWRFENCPGTLGEAKCRKGDVWSHNGNAVLDSSKTYTVKWTGNADSDAVFTANS